MAGGQPAQMRINLTGKIEFQQLLAISAVDGFCNLLPTFGQTTHCFD